MSRSHRVAIIQLYAEPMKIESNYAKAESFIRSAAAQGAELVVLPEYHLTSWVPDEPGFQDLCGQSKIYLDKYRALAKELAICIVPGTIIEKHTDPETGTTTLLNTAYFLLPNGTTAGSYIKKNLWHPERSHLHSSSLTPHPVFSTPFGTIGLLICWDLAFPEAFRELIAQGAELIIIPSFWTLNDASEEGLKYNPRAEALFLDSCLVTRCFENTCAIVFVNAGGPVEEGYAGLSQVCIPFVGPVARLGTGEEGMNVVDLDMSSVDVAEKNYRVRADMNREDWHYTYRHDSTKEEA